MDARGSARELRHLDRPADRKGHRASRDQVESSDELAKVYTRLKAADRPVLEEGATSCCYAKSEKSWITGPDGVVWEAFLTKGEATVYCNGPALSALSGNATENTCCALNITAAAVPEIECCDI